jgi:hypothetical protein
VEAALPFEWLGFDSDNGASFCHLRDVFALGEEPVGFARSRLTTRTTTLASNSPTGRRRQHFGSESHDDPATGR